MHLDLETDDVEAEVRRLEALGATHWDHQQERGFARRVQKLGSGRLPADSVEAWVGTVTLP
jgi:hypothetical protein